MISVDITPSPHVTVNCIFLSDECLYDPNVKKKMYALDR